VDVTSLADRSWPVLRRLIGVHAQIYRATCGLIGHRFPGAPPMLLLDHVGAKSGTPRTTPRAYVEDGPDVVIVASKGGHPKHPAWYHNLRAHPDTTVQIGRAPSGPRACRQSRRARPAVAEGVETYAGYHGYQQRTDREIPLVILEPRAWKPPSGRGEISSRHQHSGARLAAALLSHATVLRIVSSDGGRSTDRAVPGPAGRRAGVTVPPPRSAVMGSVDARI
jgi:deazaflavin-dependent oxidoreductase (nitroreductase family)